MDYCEIVIIVGYTPPPSATTATATDPCGFAASMFSSSSQGFEEPEEGRCGGGGGGFTKKVDTFCKLGLHFSALLWREREEFGEANSSSPVSGRWNWYQDTSYA